MHLCVCLRASKVVGLLSYSFRCFFVCQRHTHTQHMYICTQSLAFNGYWLAFCFTSQFVSLRRSWPWAKAKAKAKLCALQSSLCVLPFCKHGNWDAIASNKEKHASIPYLQKPVARQQQQQQRTTKNNKEANCNNHKNKLQICSTGKVKTDPNNSQLFYINVLNIYLW